MDVMKPIDFLHYLVCLPSIVILINDLKKNTTAYHIENINIFSKLYWFFLNQKNCLNNSGNCSTLIFLSN